MRQTLRPAIVLMLAFTLLCGVVYPLAVTGIAHLTMRERAEGSLVRDDAGRVVGSELIGQPFDDPRYFWGRPSATAAFAYDASASSGSNLGPTNPELKRQVRERVDRLRRTHPGGGAIPVDLVTTSASGLDPHVSVAAAYFQVERVARARGRDVAAVRRLVDAHVEPRWLGLLGEPVVNVLALNRALDR